MKKERYFICPNCKNLITWSKILENCSNGGVGLCDCSFCNFYWDEKYKSFQPIYARIYYDYTEITKRGYDELSKFSQVQRLIEVGNLPDSEIVKSKRKKK